MACLVHPEPVSAAPAARAAVLDRPVPRAMTRCECAGIGFQEIARQVAASGASLDEACRRTRCGQTCTACLPDLARYLSRL